MINSRYPLVLLSDIAVIYNGNSINKRIKQEKYTGLSQGRNFIATKDIDFDGTVNYENGVKIPFAESSFKTAPADCVFVCSEGGSAGKKTAYITQEVCFGNKLYAIVGKNDSFVGKYVYYFTRYSGFSSQFKDLLNGIIGGVSLKNFGSIQIPYPEKEIQESIVERIENQLSQLDSAVETLKKTKQQLEVYRQAVLKEAFSFESAEQIVEVSQITDSIRIGPFGTMLHKSDYVNDGIPVINPQHIKNGVIVPSSKNSISVEKAKELSNYQLKTNDIIMGRRGEMGRSAPVTENENGWICGTGSIFFRLKPDFDASLYSKILSSPSIVHYLEENATGTTMKNLNEDIVSHMPVPYIDKSMQNKIMQHLEEQLSVCDGIETTIYQSLQQAEALRQSILKQAFEED